MASPLMSPPHNGTPFIYFTERLSLVISTALKSYYFYVNDEWIECDCQEQYLYVSCGQPWFFNSISASSFSVIDNWCSLTSLSEDVEFSLTPTDTGFSLQSVYRCNVLLFFWQLSVYCHRWWLDGWYVPQGNAPLGKESSKIMKLWCPNTASCRLCISLVLSCRPLLVRLFCFVLFSFSCLCFWYKSK